MSRIDDVGLNKSNRFDQNLLMLETRTFKSVAKSIWYISCSCSLALKIQQQIADDQFAKATDTWGDLEDVILDSSNGVVRQILFNYFSRHVKFSDKNVGILGLLQLHVGWGKWSNFADNKIIKTIWKEALCHGLRSQWKWSGFRHEWSN